MKMSNPIQVFVSYSHKDEAFKDNLNVHLTPYERTGKIKVWDDRDIIPGQEWDNEIKEKLEKAEIILFLISPDFMASGYIYDVEIKHAIDKHNAGKTNIVPVIIRPSNFEVLSLKNFQALPKNAKAITTWSNQDEAWLDVVTQLSKLFKHLRSNGGDIPTITEPEPEISPNDSATTIQAIENLLVQEKIDKAIASMLALTERSTYADYRNQIIMQSGRWNGLKRNKNSGTISAENADLQTNRIRNALLSLLEDMAEE